MSYDDFDTIIIVSYSISFLYPVSTVKSFKILQLE